MPSFFELQSSITPSSWNLVIWLMYLEQKLENQAVRPLNPYCLCKVKKDSFKVLH